MLLRFNFHHSWIDKKKKNLRIASGKKKKKKSEFSCDTIYTVGHCLQKNSPQG